MGPPAGAGAAAEGPAAAAEDPAGAADEVHDDVPAPLKPDRGGPANPSAPIAAAGGAIAAALVALLPACGGPGGSGASDADRAGAPQRHLSPAGAPAKISVETPAERSAADEWYLNAADGCRLYVREFGIGDTVVVVHGGFGAEHSYLLDAVAGLEDELHLVLYDQRGSLRSPCPDSAVSVARHVDDLERLRAELGLGRMTILAHSMGAFLAMAYLQEHPETTGPLVLFGPFIPRMPDGPAEDSLYGRQEEEFVKWARSQEGRELEEEGLDRPDSVLTDRERTHRWRIGYASGNVYRVDRWRLVKGGQAFFDQSASSAAGRTMGQWDFTGALDAHPHPVTMILGDHDLVGFGGELHRRMVAGLQGVDLVVVPEAGHNAWIDRPARIRSLLDSALVRGSSAPSPQTRDEAVR